MDLSQTIQIISSFGVIAGIAFLAIELRQNNALLEAQARYNLIVRRADMTAKLSTPHILDALHKHSAGAELTPTQQSIVFSTSVGILEMWQWQYGEFKAGMLKRSELPIASWYLWFHEETGIPVPIRGVWEQRKSVMAPDFVAFVEENVVNR